MPKYVKPAILIASGILPTNFNIKNKVYTTPVPLVN